MWSKIRLTVVVAMLAFPAIAATDDDLTNKCVNDWKWNAITGVHFTMLKGGMLEGYRDVGMGRVYLSGNWEVVKGILHLRTSTQDASGPSAATRDIYFPIDMDKDGACWITFPKEGRKPMKNVEDLSN